MKAVSTSRIASALACVLMLACASFSSAQTAGNCAEITNDVRVAVEKDPAKVLMVVEDALVINEGCAGDIVKAAITASKADPTLAAQIVKTAVSVAPKMAGVINDSALSVVPGLASVTPAAPDVKRPAMTVADEKNPGKNPIVVDKSPVVPVKGEDFFIPSSIRGVFLLMPPVSGPLPPRIIITPVSPSNSIP
ncbi:hypothetical protein [Prosthecobacter sp.]|uniref:hypothetical protein n=1 Tax=Prosthecobacter sp. TaxID=1965333 RepID=UPI00378386FC